MILKQTYHILCKSGERRNLREIVMTSISEEEEAQLDNLKEDVLQITRGNRIFNIRINNVFCYGDIDFNDENNVNIIKDFKFLNHLNEVGVHINYGYDYESHTATTKWTETWNPLDLVMFAHGVLNKPERVVLFKTI